MEHAGTDNINGGADIEVEPRAEIQSLKDENQALKDENQALKDKALEDKVQSLKAGSTPDGSDKLGTSRDVKALKDDVQSLKAGSTPDGSDKFGTSRKVALESATKWAVAGWVNSLELTEVVAKALKEPPGTDPFEYVCNLSLADLTEKLEAEKLSGLVAPLWSAVEKLRGQGAATGAALNAKFAAEGDAFKGEMGFGGVKQYFGGLEALIGPPLMVGGSLLKAMEEEHCNKKDANLPFDTSNGIKGSTPRLEWEFVVAPVVEDPDGRYAERGGDFRTVHPEWCRKAEPLSVYEAKMADEMNPRLVEAGQAPLITEELVAGRMYTGPMYEKYNAVLRFNSARDRDGAVLLEYASMEEVPFLQKKCGWLHLGEWAATAGKGEPAAVRWTWNNKYTTTIHAINSIIVKLSPLTKITPLYRGWAGATLPEGFFTPDALGFRGGVEYGFSSTTTDRAQAVHYAEGKASTVLQLVMGMMDRGADITWLSQYPHEKETLLPPLMGLQVRLTGVEGSTLVVQCSFSINMASLTLEQVAGKRLKLLTDMGAQMAAEVRRGVAEEAAAEASQLVRIRLGLDRCAEGGAEDKRLKAPLGDKAEAYNDDVRFEAAVGDALKVKRAAVLAAAMQRGGGGGLAAAMDAVLPLQASRVDLSGFDLGDDGVMVGTVVAWMESEPSALTSLALDWGKVCGRVREALLGAVRKTHTLVALNVGDELTLNPQQLCGREVVPSLDLSNKQLGPGSAAVVAAGLSVNRVLKSLDVRYNGISGDAAQQLATAVLASPSLEIFGSVPLKELRANTLEQLDLSPGLGLPEALVLAKLVEGSGVLTSLDVGSNGLTEEAALGIVRVERQRNKLTSLGLASCSIGPTGAAEIAKYVSGSEVLKTLNLFGNNIGGETGYIEASEVEGESKEVGSKVIYQGREMVVSVGVDSDGDLKLVDVVQTGVLAIAKALEVNGVLTSLDVGDNNLTEEAALGIVRVERQRNKLTSLGLAGCRIGPTGAAEIAEYVSGSGVLKTLRLGGNKIGDEGAVAIADALRVNGVLTDLNLCSNSIRAEGAAAIAEALRGNAVLTDLNLFNNNIGPEGGIAIGKALAVNEVLTKLNLRYNSLGDEGEKAIRDVVSEREGFELEM